MHVRNSNRINIFKLFILLRYLYNNNFWSTYSIHDRYFALLHENVIWFNFNLIAIKISCASKKPQKVGGSFAYSSEGAEPLSPEIQQKLRSKYLFDDEEEAKVCERKMIRSRSVSTSSKGQEKIVPSRKHEFSALTSTEKFLNKKEEKRQETRGMLTDKRDTTSRTSRRALPPICPSSQINQKKIHTATGIY